MAHFVIAADADPVRRNQFAQNARKKLATLPGLIVRQFDCGEAVVITALFSNAPHDEYQSADSLSCLLGYAIGDAGQHLDAESIFKIWNRKVSGDEGFGGYFAAVTFSKEHGIVVGCDLLGFFPVYYTECDGALIAGSTPELLAAHPAFKAELDFTGLAGILLTNGLLSNRPLLQRVSRLRAGCQLHWNRSRGAREVEIFSLAAIGVTDGLSLDQASEIADAELTRAIRWHQPSGVSTTLMLSGGLDSRLMAGILSTENVTDNAACLGVSTDLEMQISARSAKAIGWKFHSENYEGAANEFPKAARNVARWEHLANGFSHLESETSAEFVGQIAPMFWSGFSLEDVMGGAGFPKSWAEDRQLWTFETFFAHWNVWGISPAKLSKLLKIPNSAELVRGVVADWQRDYAAAAASDRQRASCLKLVTRARLHVAGVIHRLAFRSWPLLPFLDRELLKKLLSLPPELIANRRLHKALLQHRCPALAEIPREHNSYFLEPLDPTFFARQKAMFRKRWRRWYWQNWRKEEPRRYYRCYDLNHPQWRAVRTAAEPLRFKMEEWLDRETLNQLLPQAEARVAFKDPIAHSGAARLLLGLLLWNERDSEAAGRTEYFSFRIE